MKQTIIKSILDVIDPKPMMTLKIYLKLLINKCAFYECINDNFDSIEQFSRFLTCVEFISHLFCWEEKMISNSKKWNEVECI